MFWKSLTRQAIKERVFTALDENRNYDKDIILGIPGTYLDTEQFYRDADFLPDAPYLKTFINNPNHIGCHTLTEEAGEDLFRGTQKLEIELMRLVAEDILRAAPQSTDGYVAPGGTEANIQALWIYRNYFQETFHARQEEIGVLFSEDSHYSFYKGCNLLSLQAIPVAVNREDRQMEAGTLQQRVTEAQRQGVRYFIAVANMSTTMFGSVDEPDRIADVLEAAQVPFQLHVDAAFGGFLFPFTHPDNPLDFQNPRVNSISLDAHKMLMAPYGTGIFLVRKGWMPYAATPEARYVQGSDYTLVGSRNGAQAVSIWMILQTHGPRGWQNRINELMHATEQLCQALDEMDIAYYRNPYMNIVALAAKCVPLSLTQKYRLVPDDFAGSPQWWKIVVMPHTTGKVLRSFVEDLRETAPDEAGREA
ncbi:MAG: pyridoxal-dependent decarboxylase [Schleiferiaceae bacterium]|nr:pyridoxal-dependent decarboxylase [Schleiferiaceae bacterium]